MTQYNVTGMNCAACSARVEKAVSKVEGVTSCSVSLLTNSMGVDGTADSGAIIKAVKAAGYGASLKGDDKAESKSADDTLADMVTPKLKKRLISSVVLLVVLMYFSMGHMMFGFPLPKSIENNHVAMGLIQLLLTTAIMVINQQFFISGFTSLWHRAPNMDTLVALGSAASYGWSVYALFAMTGAQVSGDVHAVMMYMDEFYFESAAMILTLITVGKMLEAKSKGKTTDALKSLMKLAPQTAVLVRDGKEAVIRKLRRGGSVAMVGDGINDAPALTRADVGIAIGAGADVAVDAADVVLVKSRLTDVCGAIKLSRAALRNIHENLFWAFIYNIIGIPLAAGCFVGLGLTLNPMFGAAAMSLSSFCVVSNALRLNLFKPFE